MSNTATRDEVIDQLREIQEQILELIDNAKGLLKAGGYDGARMRAEAYWIPHVITAISNDHGYLGGSMTTLQDTIEEIENGEDDDEGDDA